MLKKLRGQIPTIVVAAVTAGIFGGGGAYAAAQITSSQIADNTIQSGDIRDGSIQARDVRSNSMLFANLSQGTRDVLLREWNANTRNAGLNPKDVKEVKRVGEDKLEFISIDGSSLGTVNIQGVQGIQGLPGEKGVQGEAGAAGDAGDQGEAGAAGDQGVAGATGDQGAAGATGDQGAAGAKGDQGEPGSNGVANYNASNNEVRIQPGQTASIARNCPAGKVALGGGYTSDGAGKGLHVIANSPAQPAQFEVIDGVNSVTGWTVTAENTGTTADNVKVWVTCATMH